MSRSFKTNFRLLLFSRFFQEIVFWYPIFIAFAYSINLSLEQISISIVAINLGVILFEVPSGVLADRWSRTGTLILGTLTLGLSTLIFALSTSALHYIVASFIWGIFFALQSGTHDSLIYDLLKKESATKRFKFYLGRYHIYGTAGLIFGSVAGSIVAEAYSLKTAYLITLVPTAISLVPLLFVQEPKSHQESQEFSSFAHYGVAFRQLVATKELIAIVAASVFVTAGISFLFELNQVYYFAAGLPLFLYGAANASLQFSIGAGTWLAGTKSNRFSIVAAISMLVSLAVFVLFNVSVLSAILISAIQLCLFYLTYVFGHFIQDAVTSEVRSAASSMVSTGGRLLFTAVIILFGVINNSKDEVNGFVILLAISVAIAFITLLYLNQLSNFDKRNS